MVILDDIAQRRGPRLTFMRVPGHNAPSVRDPTVSDTLWSTAIDGMWKVHNICGVQLPGSVTCYTPQMDGSASEVMGHDHDGRRKSR